MIISISVISLFVIKSSASQDSVYIEGCTPYNIEIKKGDILGSVVISACTGTADNKLPLSSNAVVNIFIFLFINSNSLKFCYI